MVKKSFADYNLVHTDTDDAEHSGRPIEVVTPGNRFEKDNYVNY